MALSPDQQTRLAKLQAAYDQLISGKAVAAIDFAGRRTQYSRADVDRLKAEIDGLVAASVARTGRTRGSVRFRL